MYLCSQTEELLDIRSLPAVQIIQALGKRFREYRIAAQMTQKEVSEQSGVSLLTIRRFEQGYSYDIKLGNLIALLKAIDFAEGIADLLPEIPASVKYSDNCFGGLLEFVSYCHINSLIVDINVCIVRSEADKSPFNLQTNNKSMMLKINADVYACIKTFGV